MPPSCLADTSGKRNISHNDPSPKSSPSESHPVAHLYHSKAADGGSQIPKAKSTSPSRRNQRQERLRGKSVAKREMQQFQGILSSRVPHPHPWHDHPRSPFMFVGLSGDLLGAVPFMPPRARSSRSLYLLLRDRKAARVGASERTTDRPRQPLPGSRKMKVPTRNAVSSFVSLSWSTCIGYVPRR